ncbi:T9SS type A sorting domain-containing protein [Saprospiraceae bacterium]|nr:T9SS type A sorting domain-containing protein [Saprospiraceae bacterium]
MRSILLFVFAITSYWASAQCPTPEILGDFSVCGGETVTYSVDTFTAGNTYTYALANGGTILSEADGNVTVEWNGAVGGMYQLSLVESDGVCSGNAFANVTIEDDPVLVCNDNLNISLSNSCILEITSDIILESPEFPEDSYEISVLDENGNPAPTTLDGSYVGQTVEITVTHLCSGNKCWGNVTIEDKLAPVIECENDTLTCAEFATYSAMEPTLVSDNCGDATFTSTTTQIQQGCTDEFYTILEVTWVATDASGNSSAPCTQMIFVEKTTISELTYPLNYDGLAGNKAPLSCSGNFPLNSEGLPDPSFTGIPGGTISCSNIEWTYTDVVLPLCDEACTYSNSSYKVIRTFVVVDWCTGEIVEMNQIIKVQDTTAPSITPIDDITASVNPFDCSAQVLLPLASATDNCTSEESITYDYTSDQGSIINGVLYLDSPAKTMGQGVMITVTASDCCGNMSEESFFVTTQDNTPPVVVADAHEVISLLPSGIATMLVASLDDGSYDNCGPVGFFAKRMDNGGGNPGTDVFPPNGPDNAQYNEAVHFYCADIANNPIMVQFQVCDDADMNGTFGSANDNCNIAMVEVEVQDKFAPVIQCPANMTISCTEFEGVDLNDQSQINTLFGEAVAAGTCGASITQTISGTNDLECGEGVIFRNFTATTGAGTATCSQTIVVQPFANNLLTCDRISFEGLNNNVYNWCAVNDNTNDDDDDLPALNIDGCEAINFAEVNINTAGLCTTVGVQTQVDTFNYASSSACKKYVVHYEVIDNCVFDENYVNPMTGQIDPYNSNNGYFEFYLEYNVVDSEAPTLTCTNQTVEAESCEGYAGTFSIEAEDSCTPADELIYEWRLDVNGDGSVDLPFTGWFTGNAVNGAAIGLPAIPVGNHIVLWRVNDGCGNFETCSQAINITNFDKAPTPYCLGGLSTAVMNTDGTVAIWAIDFDNGSEDDCGGPVTITMIPELDAEASSNPWADSEPSWSFGCEDITNGVFEVLEIRIYVTDDTGAFDYCTATLRVEDNEADFCPDNITITNISGEIKTETGKALAAAKVELMSMQPEYPTFTNTNNEGEYSFNSVLYSDYQVSAEDNTNYLSGVSTLDIVLIQKHILGLDPLDSPYKMIAADVNNDCLITGVDMIQVRRLILGKYTDDILPSNESWRFVNENQTFENVTQPCDLIESYDINELAGPSESNNFVAVKIADINESSIPGLNGDGDEAELRSDEALKFIIENKEVNRNEVVRIPVFASNMNDIYGFQFGLDFEGMMINGVEKGAIALTSDYVGMNEAENGTIMISFNEANPMNFDDNTVLFTILATATTSGDLVSRIKTSPSEEIISEAYATTDLTVANVEVSLREGSEIIPTIANFSLLQNMPNPFAEMTNIRFELPRAGQANLKIFDLTGKLLYAKTDVFTKGYNQITLSKDDINVSGELFYQLEFDGKVQTKKMILIK